MKRSEMVRLLSEAMGDLSVFDDDDAWANNIVGFFEEQGVLKEFEQDECGCKSHDEKLFRRTGISKCMYCGKEDRTLEKK